MAPKREEKIFLFPKEEGFEVRDRDDNVLLEAGDDYYIYFKNVNFNTDGSIDARHLGENPHSIIDEYCKILKYSPRLGYWQKDRDRIYTARMVAVSNKSKRVIFIQ
ncbi:hypothetical protein AB3N02_22040 [Priestia aryabhattai]|uniref:hypothetical protein n=1 Tax=Priestia aryabhattai TaxID=412384 RepID=UPI0039A36E3F